MSPTAAPPEGERAAVQEITLNRWAARRRTQ